MTALEWLLIGFGVALAILLYGWTWTLWHWQQELRDQREVLDARAATLEEWHRALEKVDDR